MQRFGHFGGHRHAAARERQDQWILVLDGGTYQVSKNPPGLAAVTEKWDMASSELHRKSPIYYRFLFVDAI
jgi:hypothetical protein